MGRVELPDYCFTDSVATVASHPILSYDALHLFLLSVADGLHVICLPVLVTPCVPSVEQKAPAVTILSIGGSGSMVSSTNGLTVSTIIGGGELVVSTNGFTVGVSVGVGWEVGVDVVLILRM